MYVTDNIIYWVVYFIITVLIAWVALSLILIWARPALYNADGYINWWTTLWVAALVILLAWLIIILLVFLVSLFTSKSNRDSCAPKQPLCPKPCPKPCAKPCSDMNYMKSPEAHY